MGLRVEDWGLRVKGRGLGLGIMGWVGVGFKKLTVWLRFVDVTWQINVKKGSFQKLSEKCETGSGRYLILGLY